MVVIRYYNARRVKHAYHEDTAPLRTRELLLQDYPRRDLGTNHPCLPISGKIGAHESLQHNIIRTHRCHRNTNTRSRGMLKVARVLVTLGAVDGALPGARPRVLNTRGVSSFNDFNNFKYKS